MNTVMITLSSYAVMSTAQEDTLVEIVKKALAEEMEGLVFEYATGDRFLRPTQLHLKVSVDLSASKESEVVNKIHELISWTSDTSIDRWLLSAHAQTIDPDLDFNVFEV